MPFKPKIVLFDGTAIMYSAFYAMPSLTASDGLPTGAIKGFDNIIKQLHKRFSDAVQIMVFDAKGKNFRHQISSDYKATRKPMPDDLVAQIEYIKQIPSLLGLPVICMTNVEADDVIGTLAKQASIAQLETVIVTPDKDMNQLIDEKVHIYNARKDVWVRADSVYKQYGIAVSQFIDYLSLVGDASDNITGVDKVGPKTATKLLQKYGDIENILTNADKISGLVGQNIKNSRETINLARKLATIDTNLDIELDDFKMKEPDEASLAVMYQRLGFATTNSTKKTTNSTIKTEIIQPENKKALSIKWQGKPCAVYILQSPDNTLLGASLYSDNQALYIPLDQQENKQLLQEIVASAPHTIHMDAKHNCLLLGVEIPQQTHDILLSSYVLNANETRTLTQLAHIYLQNTIADSPLKQAQKSRTQLLPEIDTNALSAFAGQCAEIIWQLHQLFTQKLAQDESLANLLHNIEVPLMQVLARMESAGILIDCELLENYSQEIQTKIEQLEDKIFAYSDAPFNVSSPKQVQDFLFNKLKLPAPKKTSSGQASTSDSVLQSLSHPVADYIKQYRGWQKLKTGYTDSLPKTADKNNRVHTTFNQTTVVTGRLSSSNPNLQNIPVKTEAGRKIRSAFIAKPSYSIVSADYSQIELRIMAHLAQDEVMIKDFNNNVDIHTATAAKVFNLSLDEVSKEQRRQAKAINFGLIYGTTSFGLARQLGVSRPEAQSFIDAYFKRYPSIHDYMEQSKINAHEQGFTQTITGRKLPLHHINDKNSFIRAATERLAINAPIQGSAADIIKIAMLDVQKWLDAEKPDAVMLLQVHDELVFEVRTEQLASVEQAIVDIMCSVMELTVPLIVDVGRGANWNEAH